MDGWASGGSSVWPIALLRALSSARRHLLLLREAVHAMHGWCRSIAVSTCRQRCYAVRVLRLCVMSTSVCAYTTVRSSVRVVRSFLDSLCAFLVGVCVMRA